MKRFSETDLITWFKRNCPFPKGVVKGIGDDAAVMEFDKKSYLLWTIDTIEDGVHFTLKDDPLLIGMKAICVSISDIAAMAGEPKYALISIGVPEDIDLNRIKKIYKGILKRASRYNVSVVGGDSIKSSRLTISSTVIGFVEKELLVTRQGAQAGDIISVSGTLGSSQDHHLSFLPQVKHARLLSRAGLASSMIDLSDGLYSDLEKICCQNKLGALLFENKIPLQKNATLKDALYKGEDFRLLFTSKSSRAKKTASFKAVRSYCIGVMRKQRGIVLKKDRRLLTLKDESFKHFG